MRSIRVVLTVPGRTIDDVYATIADFTRYPKYSDAVRSVSVFANVTGSVISTWEVNFRNGILRWTEEDTLDSARHHIEFRQLDGDIAAFDGSWNCLTSGSDVTVTFAARVDLGIPSLADALEPIAVRTIVANTVAIVTGLLGQDVQVQSVDDAPIPTSCTIAAGG